MTLSVDGSLVKLQYSDDSRSWLPVEQLVYLLRVERWESVPASAVVVGDVVRFRYGDEVEILGVAATIVGITFRVWGPRPGHWCRPTEVVSRRVV